VSCYTYIAGLVFCRVTYKICFESDLRRNDTSGNFPHDLGELLELNLLIDD